MSAKVLSKSAAKEAQIDIIEDGRGTQAVHDVMVAMRAARRSGTANTKTKAEVDLSGAKPWRQKGTGRARAGYKSSPIWRGGGVVFGPKPRDYSKKISKSVRRLAFRKALSERINAGDVLTIDKFVVPEFKTKSFVDLLRKQTDAGKVLIVSDSFDEKTFRSAGNVKRAVLATASDVNTEQLLRFQKILVTQKGLEKLAEDEAQGNERTFGDHPDRVVDRKVDAAEREAEQVRLSRSSAREQGPDQERGRTLVPKEGGRCEHLQLRGQMDESARPVRPEAELEKGNCHFEGGREDRPRLAHGAKKLSTTNADAALQAAARL